MCTSLLNTQILSCFALMCCDKRSDVEGGIQMTTESIRSYLPRSQLQSKAQNRGLEKRKSEKAAAANKLASILGRKRFCTSCARVFQNWPHYQDQSYFECARTSHQKPATSSTTGSTLNFAASAGAAALTRPRQDRERRTLY